MATFKLHIGRMRGCPDAETLLKAMNQFGLAPAEEFGVKSATATEQSVFATLIHRTQKAVDTEDDETGEIEPRVIQTAKELRIGVCPKNEHLECYDGGPTSLEHLAVFFSAFLALPTVIDAIELDLPAAVDRLAETASKFQVRSVRVTDYAANSYCQGVYAPKFLSTEHAREFLQTYADYLTAVSVRFAGGAGRVGVNLQPTASYGLTCDEEDQAEALALLRKLTGEAVRS